MQNIHILRENLGGIFYMNLKMSVKKIISLFLALVIVMATFSLMSCGKKSEEQVLAEIGENADDGNRTISMYLMSEDPVDPITEAQVEEAINEITQKRLSTKLDLRYFTVESYEYFSYMEGNVEKVLYMNAANEVNDKGNGKMITSLDFVLSTIDLAKYPKYTKAKKLGYYDAIDKAIADRKVAEANGSIKADQQNAEGSNETVLDEYDIPMPKYPAITDYHIDIFYIGGKDNFLKYKNELYGITNDQINQTTTISASIPKLFLANIKSLNGGTYAIPTSKAVGEYTYLLLNKEALEAAYLKNKGDVPTDYSSFTSLTSESVKDFLDYIVSDTNTLSDTYYPISTNVSSAELLISNLQYWGVDDSGKLCDAFSVLGGYYGKNDNYLDANTYAKFENLFVNETFVNEIKTLKEYELNGYYNADENKKFAVGYYECDAAKAEALIEKYGEDYEILTVEIPRVDEDDLYSDMFAINVNVSDSSKGKSLKVLELMNSDETFRNILLYGVENEHYRLESTGVNNKYGEEIKSVTISPSSRYHMALEKTGNTFIAYPQTGDSYTFKEFGIAQNQEANTRLDLGFEVGSDSDAESLKALKDLSAAIWADYKAITSMDDFDVFIASAIDRIDKSEAVKANINGNGLSKDYNAWLVANKIIKE